MNKFVFIVVTLAAFLIVSYSLSFLVGVETGNNIALISIKGAITTTGDGIPLQPTGASSTNIVEQLEDADEDKTIKAVVLEIDSPGGTVLASKEIADKVKEFGKPVVALIRGSGASGAYWVASATDYIIADEMSIIGSIGVTSSYLEFSGLLEDYKVDYQRLVTGEFKDIGTPYKDLTDKERELFMGKLNQIHNFFVEEVAENRNLSVAKVGKLATGEVFLGQEAIKLDLIDELGGEDEAINISKKLAGITEAEIVEYYKAESILNYVFDSKFAFNIGQGIGSVLVNSNLKSAEIRA